MSKKFFLLLVLIAATGSNQILAAEICDITDTIQKDLTQNKVTMLGGIFNSLSNFAGFGQKEQNDIANDALKQNSYQNQNEIVVEKTADEPIENLYVENLRDVTIKDIKETEIKKEWYGTEILQQISNRAKTLFGISFDKKELMYFGASAVALITLGGIVYVLYKYKDKNNLTFNWTLQKVSQDMKQFVIDHETAIKSSIITAVVVAIVALCAKKPGIRFENASINRFVKQSTLINHVSVLK